MGTRSQRRAASRDQARREARYNIGHRLVKDESGKAVRIQVGGPPRRAIAIALPECAVHHRKLPCKRCPGVDA